MRDFNLCKARVIGTKTWVEGYYLYLEDREQCKIVVKNKERKGYVDLYDVNPETICRFTGIKDKNRQKIWEHDIVRDGDGNIYVVKFWRGSFVLEDRVGERETFIGIAYTEPTTGETVTDDIERIGSIFDNPELLEGE